MADRENNVGKVGWIDLTVENANKIKDFYSGVVGWNSEEFDMGGYSDFNMKTPINDETVAGICNRMGTNSDIPAGWIMYITVGDIEESVKKVESMGGKLLTQIKSMGEAGKYVFVTDPEGNSFALFEGSS